MCLITFDFLFLLFYYYGHNITCKFHNNLCTPFSYWFHRMPNDFEPITSPQQNEQFMIAHSLQCHSNIIFHKFNQKLNQKLNHNNKCHKNVNLMIELSAAHSGSTMLVSLLQSHTQIHMSGEVLFDFRYLFFSSMPACVCVFFMLFLKTNFLLKSFLAFFMFPFCIEKKRPYFKK